MITLVRQDIFDEWGWPTAPPPEDLPSVTLEGVLDRGDKVSRGLWLDEAEFPVSWLPTVELQPTAEQLRRPVVVGTVAGGGLGCRVYRGMLPSMKTTAGVPGAGGSTHLVAQRRGGKWAARRLSAQEMRRIYDPDGVLAVIASDPDEELQDYGGSSPVRMVQPHAQGLVRFLRPPLVTVPQCMEDIISPQTVQICRGWMANAATDFDQMAKQN
jgi:hypothetical protein